MLKKNLDERQREFYKQLELRDEKIRSLEERHVVDINSLRIKLCIPPYEHTISNYRELKATYTCYYSENLYTHPGGYNIRLRFNLNGCSDGRSTHVSIVVDILRGEYDDKLKFPARFTVTLELVNQHRDQDHIVREIHCEYKERVKLTYAPRECGSCTKFISHTDLEWNESKQTQYLKNDCLKFRKCVYPIIFVVSY